MPATAQASSLSDTSPEIPTAPMTAPPSPSRISTPPGAGTTRPSDMALSAAKNACCCGCSATRRAKVREPAPIPSAPQALPMAICGRMMPAPSSRANAFRCPPASRTATASGAQPVSRPFRSAASTIVVACCRLSSAMEDPPLEMRCAALYAERRAERVLPSRRFRPEVPTTRSTKELSMKVAIAIVALVMALAIGASPAAAQSKSDLTVALSSFSTEVLDPVLGGHVVKYYMSLMFDYLVGVTPDGQLSRDTGLATRWEPSSDHRRWTFHLRRGVKFHTGDEVTSEDVKFSLQRAIGKRSTTGYAGPLRALIADIETPAPDRLVIVTKDPTLIIPTYLSRSLSTEGMILPKKYIESVGDDVFARKPIGTGPYKFVEQVTGSHIKLAAVDSHWRIGTPKYKTMMFRLVPEEATRIALLRRGEVDVADVSRERVKELEKEGFPLHYRREEAILTMWWVLGPDGRTAPSKDKRVREALNLALDRAEIAQSIFGGKAEPAAIPLGLSWSFKDVGFKQTPDMLYPYDPARAKKLLADAGVASGLALDVYAYQLPGLPEGKTMAEAVAGYWEKIGIKTKLIPVDYPAFRKAWFDRTVPGAVGYFNIANRDWIGAYALLEKQAYTPSKPSDTVNDPEIDGMLSQVMRQTDKEKINALMRGVYARLRSEHLGVPVVYLHSPYATSKTLGNWNVGSVMYDLFFDVLASGK